MTFDISTGIEICWIALALLWLAGTFFSKPTERAQSAGARSIHIALAVIGGLLIGRFFFRGTWMDAHFVPGTHSVRLAGFLSTLAGTLFAVWARLTLGSNWSGRATVKSGHELIVKGPYSLARHPIYTGVLLALAGTLLVQGRWRCIVGFAVILLALAIKISQEERLMMETFPAEYPEYKRRVKALVPFVF